jgi:integrase
VLGIAIDNGDEADKEKKRRRRKEDGGKSLKTKSSKRWVPLHPVLLAAGFEQHVEGLRARGERRLFPELAADRHGKLTAAFSKSFGRLLDGLGLGDRALVFHSFRHGFKSACRRAELPVDIHDHLTGHSDRSVGRRHGREFAPRLAQAMARVHFPAIDAIFAPGWPNRAGECASPADPAPAHRRQPAGGGVVAGAAGGPGVGAR